MEQSRTQSTGQNVCIQSIVLPNLLVVVSLEDDLEVIVFLVALDSASVVVVFLVALEDVLKSQVSKICREKHCGIMELTLEEHDGGDLGGHGDGGCSGNSVSLRTS